MKVHGHQSLFLESVKHTFSVSNSRKLFEGISFSNFVCYLFVTAFLMLNSSIAIAQKSEFIVELKPERFDLPQREFYIDSIVDARMVKNTIGMAQVGMGNRQVPAVFNQPIETVLLNYFKVALPGQKIQQPLVAVINQLAVSERTYAMKERGLVDLEITFCKLDSGRLLALGSFNSKQEGGGMDVTAAHGKRIAAALNDCITQFHNSPWKEIPGTIYTAENEWNEKDPDQNILHCTVRKPGIYPRFVQLRSNAPIEQRVTIEPRKDLFMIRDEVSEKKVVEAFGYCDGKYLYINTFFYNFYKGGRGLFARVVEEGRYMAWVDHYVSASESAAVGAAFGLIGTAIASSGRDVIVLDIKTGVITPLKAKTLKRLFYDDVELQKKYEDEPNQDNIDVMLAYIKSYNQRHPL